MSASVLPAAWCRALCLSLVSATALIGCGGGGGGGATAAAALSSSPVPITSTPVPGSPTSAATSAASTLRLSLPRRGLVATDLAVIVAEGDALSEAVGAYYQKARGIPAANLIRVRLATGVAAISAAEFATLKAEIDAKLPAGVQATLLTWTAPSRVAGACSMSITSAIALGFDTKYCGSSCTSTAASPLYDSESSQPWIDHKIRPAMMLGSHTLAAAQALIDRGVSADASYPAGEGYLLRTTDAARSVRYADQQPLPARWASKLQLNYLDNSTGGGGDSLDGKRDLLFYFTGQAKVAHIATNTFRPGAIADHLTSYGGVLPGGNGQMPITDWLEAGATASFGTVEEPCNYTQKFSRASVLIDQYWRGATLIEAYWKSVEWPGQGLFIGEPLAQPFRDAPTFSIESGQYLINTRALRPGSRYLLDYLTPGSSSWTTLASFSTAAAQAQSLRAPLPPAEATQIRWVGPCPGDATRQCTLASSS
ncbi:hypothetical protein BH11PSE10_BH11PSE10_14880 [soil metagenome]